MKLPTAADYRDAIQEPQGCFADQQLRAAQVVTDELGLPRPISGNFASVFEVIGADQRRYAVRCFVRYADDQQQRYDAIATFLAGVDAPWKVDFSFLADGILIDGRWLPMLKMEWIEGLPLDRYVASQLGNRQALLALAGQFAQAIGDLERQGAAHGDLQHGNLLVTADGQLKLIDYDGMYVPALAGREGHELGHRNYQHPARSRADLGPGIDNFSAWVIYASLLALAIDPTLWTRLDGGEEKLIFSREDFIDPALGLGLRGLELTGDHRLLQLADIIKGNLRREPRSVDALRTIAVTPGRDDAREQDVLSAATGSGANGGAPAAGAGAGANVSFSHAGRTVAKLAIAAVLAGLVMFALGLAALASPGLAAAGIIVIAAGVAMPPVAFRLTPELRRKRGWERSVVAAHQALGTCENEAEPIERQLRALGDRTLTLVEHAQQALAQRQDALTLELQKLAQATQKRLATIDGQRREVIEAAQRQEREALRAFQEGFYQSELAHCEIRTAAIAGIDRFLATALAAHGVETAADFTGVRELAAGDGGRVAARQLGAAIVLPSGRLLQLPGVLPSRAQALERWRLAMRMQVQGRIPRSLPAATRAQLAAAAEPSLHALDAAAHQAREDGRTRIARIRADHHAEEQRATAEVQREQASLRAQRQALVDALERADSATRNARSAARQADEALVSYREINFRNYLLAGASETPGSR